MARHLLLLLTGLFSLALFATGCRSPERAPEQSLPQNSDPVSGEVSNAGLLRGDGKRRWTSMFQERRLLLADEIQIEGPPGLLEHVATRLDPEVHTEEVKTTVEGLRQTYRVRAEFMNQAEPIACYLDELEAHALRRIIVLERPGLVPVRVTARGDVYAKNFGTGEEERSPALVLEGPLDLEETPKAVGAPEERASLKR